MKQYTEKQIKEKVKEILKRHNIFYFMPAGSIYGKGGLPDFVCCINGFFIGIETKSTVKGVKGQTALQKNIQKEILICKGEYYLIYDDVTLEFLNKSLNLNEKTI